MTYEDNAFMDYCERQAWKRSPQYLHFLIAYPIAIAISNPEYTEDF
jgi:hypothetical protein